ncbi:MAG TPA: hypothetical protein PK668_06200 [Myxococcota bacterium]|nr:hypothetical protein [Myxococcota bacterium]HRY92567.1 hypothetical protein [Myxococcota bacterium]
MLRALVIAVVVCLVFWAVLVLAFQSEEASSRPAVEQPAPVSIPASHR